MKTKFMSKLLGVLLVLVMVLALVPVGALTAFAAGPTEITEIKSVISAEHVPKAGMEVDLFMPNVPDGEPYSRPWNGAEWYDSKGVKIAPTVNHHYDLGYEFEAGHTYYADYQYIASDGYVFAENPTITLIGPDPSMFTYEIIDRWDNNEAVTVRYTFTIPGEFENADINKVSMIYYGLPKDGGKKPDRCNVIYNNCTITREEWNKGTWGSNASWGTYTGDGSNAPTFLAGETYVHMIELTAKNGYKFSSDLHVQKGTQDAEEYGVVTLSADRTVATVKFTYEIPEIEIINTIELRAANQHMNFCLRSGESIYLPQPFIAKYAFDANCPYKVDGVNACKWYVTETEESLRLGYPHTFESGKKYTLKFNVRIKDEFEATHKFASGTDLGLNITDYQYASSDFVEFKISGGDQLATVEVTFTCRFPDDVGQTADNPAMCYSYEEFKYAMESPDIRYVALGSMEDMLPMIPHDEEQEPGGITRTAIVVRGTKDLNLLGDAVFRCPLTGNYDLKYYIQLLTLTDAANSSLYIHGPGSLTYAGGTLNFVNSVIKVEGGNLCVDGATVRGSNGYHTGFCYGINAIFGSVSIQGGATVIGEIYGGEGGIGALTLGSEGVNRSLSVSIFDGKFYVERDEGDSNEDYGIIVNNDIGLRIYGMFTDGIKLGRYAADTLADYVMDGYTMTVNGVKTDPASCGTTNGFVEVYQEISKINIHVNSPVAGESPTIYDSEVYLVPEGATVESIIWYENGQPWNLNTGAARFTAGNTYTVEITLTADDGVYFANPLTSATINYKNAAVSAFAGNPETGVVLTVDLGECPNVVPNVNLTVTAPKEGNTPSYTIGCGSDAYYVVGGSSNYTDYRQWYVSYDGDEWFEMDPSLTFTAGRHYKLYVDIRTNNGYEFPLIDNGTIQPNVSATVNGYYATVYKAYEQDPSRYITVEYNFGECSDSVVENIIIENVTAPVAGEKPNYNWSIRGSGYQMNTAKNAYEDIYWKNPPEKWYYIKNGLGWFDVTDFDWVYENETFIAGHEYEVRVYVITEDGFEFAHDRWYAPTVTATVNGNTAEAIVDGSDCVITQQIEYTFTCEAKVISTIMIYDLENPVGGNVPDTSVTPAYPEYYTVESVKWFDIEDNPAGAVFESGVPYYALITVAPAEGVVFADAENMTAYIDGNILPGVEIENNKVIIPVIIRKPASAPIGNPYVFLTQPQGGTVMVGEALNTPWETSFIPTRNEIQYWDGEDWDQWDVQYPQNALDDYDFESVDAAIYRFRIVAYIGSDAVATSNEFAIAWKESAHECVVLPESGQGATCTVDGWKDYYRCECGKYYEDANCQTPINDLEAWKVGAGKIVAEHKYGNLIEKQSVVHTQTELKAGMEAHYKCSVCQAYFDENKKPTTEDALIIAKPEHSYGDWVKDNEKHWKVCSCGLKADEHTHNYTDNADMICNVCGWDRTVPHACGNGTKQNGQGATCTVNGWKNYYKCSCGKIYTDAACTNEITSFEEWKNGDGKIAAAHSYGDLIAKADATCTQEGMQAHFECSVCHTLFDADKAVKTKNELTITIDANAHNHGSEWKTDEGKHWNECECGDKANKAAHTDSNNDGKCDTCEYQMSTTPDNPNNTPDDPSEDKDGLGAGAIIAIVLGVIVLLSVGGYAILWFVVSGKSFAELTLAFKEKDFATLASVIKKISPRKPTEKK